jgi:hypothetical protein
MSALVSSGCATAGQRTSTFMSNSPGVLRVATSLPAPGFWNGTNAGAVTGGFEYAIAQKLATAVGATVGTDTLSLAVLAAVAGSATGSLSGITLVVAIVAGPAILGVWCLVILPLLGRFFYTHIGFHPTIRYAFVLMALLSAAALAEVVGVEAIVGATISPATKLGRAVALVFAHPESAAPAIDIAARLAGADDGVVLPRLAVVGEADTDETRAVARLEELIARRGLDCDTLCATTALRLTWSRASVRTITQAQWCSLEPFAHR